MSGLDVLGGFMASALVVVLLALLDYYYHRRIERLRRR
jgi:membrane-associated phospholipid phosphatase